MISYDTIVKVIEAQTCAGCRRLRAEIVEALRGVDTSDWNSMEGSTLRPLSEVLSAIASRLDALGGGD